ncbi:class I histocompatibility antigen, F10 alpha chain-like [Gracilinanus agilis]|uniref:class I histocompatibility antigen, F10 alpha chain-like n=1 Tax=Gracilinanus agilis TaxID=191870 RepID=UPI001CFF4056|nr:class I histocompatibility antigen, F10 alpha chain-like [Gracilinanus agilis]
MENKRRRRESFIDWLLMLGVFALCEFQAEGNKTSQQEPTHMGKKPEEPQIPQGHHRLESKFIAVGTSHSLFNFTIIYTIDDVQVCAYNKGNKQTVFSEAWIAKALEKDFIEHKKEFNLNAEKSFRWLLNLLKNDTKSDKNHTIQLYGECELDNDIPIGSQIQFAVDGEDFIKTDDTTDHWIVTKPEAESFRMIVESTGFNMRKKTIKYHCADIIRKILKHSNLKENVAPEVTVSRHDVSDGRVSFNCTATGFYPRSIMMRWEKGGQLGVWGHESSSGTLPNADSTFYLQITLELPPGDSGAGYACVVEHDKLQAPAVHPVPEKPTERRPWVLALGLLTAVILVLSCSGAFIMWNKKTGQKTLEHATVGDERSL